MCPERMFHLSFKNLSPHGIYPDLEGSRGGGSQKLREGKIFKKIIEIFLNY